MYYNEIVAPNLRKAFIDDDFNKCTKMYLVGGGALYPELVDCFKEEFGDIVSVNVYPEPEKCASQGYCLSPVRISRIILKRKKLRYSEILS